MSKRIQVDITVPNQTKYLGVIGRIGESVVYSLKGYQGNRRELAYHLNLVLTEALANAICHANSCDPDKDVRVLISASDKDLTIKVFDQGQGFDIEALSKHKARTKDEGGRGIQIIFKLMDRVHYTREENRNVLEMTKYLH
ncbi:MAG: ATP-binding protein [Thermodesulfobacteriota bacterium]|nr:ATP-binding protein [Thermodesulfobacteriota bacterium]